MGVITTAAFDPIFWAHHCFVEKLFCDWQDRVHPSIPDSIAGQTLAGFTASTNDEWDYHALGYRYQAEGANVVPSARPAMLASAAPPSSLAATFDLTKVPDGFERASLAMAKTSSPEQSLEARVFFGPGVPTADTETEGNPNFAGSFYLFGHGGCTGDEGHCDVPVLPEDATRFAVLQPMHHLTPQTYTLDVTAAVSYAKTNAPTSDLPTYVLLVDPNGVELPPSSLVFERLVLDAV
jgi:tyrosinase